MALSSNEIGSVVVPAATQSVVVPAATQSTVLDAKMSARAQALLRSPCCRALLEPDAEGVDCTRCGTSYPVSNGVPVLLDERSSIFRIQDVLDHRDTFFKRSSYLKRTLRRLVPDLSANVKVEANLQTFIKAVSSETPEPIVLIVGAGVAGRGMDVSRRSAAIEWVETDIAHGPRTVLICDGHDLPFESDSFDGVIVQAVLEHVIDPVRCVDEIHRVLKKRGIAYAEVPFMQQVHGRQYDFTRFTHLGLRRLFRSFTEVDSGATCGPGMVLAWSYEYLLLSCVRSRLARLLVGVFVRFTAFWLKYLDFLIIATPGTLDAASSYYFLGRKSHEQLSDRELLRLYRGAC